MFLFDPNSIDIYTDGSARPKNPGPGAFGIWIDFPEAFNEEIFKIQKAFIRTTNNRMELRGCIEALKIIQKNQVEWKKKAKRIRIITDSLYVYSHINIAQFWKNNGWKNKDGRPILNDDLWDEFLKMRPKAPAEFFWQKGKTTNQLKIVDDLAKKAVDDPIKHKDIGYIEGNVSRAKLPREAALLYPAMGQEEIIRVYKYRRANHTSSDHIISFELFDFDENVYTGKYCAHATEQQKIKFISRNQWYKVKFNNNKAHPKFEEIEDWIE